MKGGEKMNKLILTGIIAVLIAGGFVLIGGKKDNNVVPIQPPLPPEESRRLERESEGSVQQVTVALSASGFAPQTIKIKFGTKVVWVNKSGATATVNSALHPTHLVYPPLNLNSFEDGQSLSLVFDKSGTYKYHDHLNPSRTGTVVVE